MTEVYSRIKAEVGEGVPIVAMPYPLTTTEAGCDSSPFTEEEHDFVVELTGSSTIEPGPAPRRSESTGLSRESTRLREAASARRTQPTLW